MAFNTTSLLTRIRLKGRLSSSDADYTDANLLDLADQALVSHVYPLVKGTNGDYYLTHEDISLTSGRNNYPIPNRAYQNTIESIHHLNSDKTAKDYIEYGAYRDIDIGLSGTPVKHTIDDDEIHLFATPSVTGEYLRVRYFYTPSALVATTACMLITGGTDTGVLTGNAPSGWSTANSFDIVSGTSPFSLIHADLTASAVSAGVSVTFTLSDLDTNRLGTGVYYVTLADQTCFPMAPKELHHTLADLTACTVFSHIGDELWQAELTSTLAVLRNQVKSIVPRKHSENKPWVRRYSPLRCRV